MARRTTKSATATRSAVTKRKGRPIGRPTALTDRTEETLLGYLMDGLGVEVSCNLAGVHQATYYRWMEKGEDARKQLDEDGAITETQDRYREFREAALVARSQSVRKMVGIIHRTAEGGHLLHEEPIVDVQGIPQYDHDGNLLMRRSYSAPNGNLALRFLERHKPADWSLRAQVEVSGSGGGPVKVEHSVEQVLSLAERLQAVKDERGVIEAEDAAIGDVIQGEGTWSD